MSTARRLLFRFPVNSNRIKDHDPVGTKPFAIAPTFSDEDPTVPRAHEGRARSSRPQATDAGEGQPSPLAGIGRDAEIVAAHVPLDVVPTLAVPFTEVPWHELGELATQLLRRVDGNAHAMSIVMGLTAAPRDGARELATLVRRGLLRWALPESPHAADRELGASAA
jgi:hypothetical protein